MAVWQINDEARLRTLREFGIMDSGYEPEFDAIAAEAADLCGTPVGLVTLLDAERQWFKARVGTDVAETPVQIAICGHALAHGDTLIIPDLADDRRTRANPLVIEGPKVRFYAGTPIVTFGQALGTLCVLDTEPRPGGLSPTQQAGLELLAAKLVDLITPRKRPRR